MEWRRLTQPEEPAFGRAMALYEASFPRHEQRLPDEQRAVLSHLEYHFTQLFDGAEFVGLLLYWEAEDFRYVEHFCVRPELRGRRYGAKALEELGRKAKFSQHTLTEEERRLCWQRLAAAAGEAGPLPRWRRLALKLLSRY